MDKKIMLLFLCCIYHQHTIVSSALQVGFYGNKCRGAESIVQQEVQRWFSTDRSITAALLRMYFHDCFVRGCDASILIDSKNTQIKQSEKDAGPNQSVRGYELIDRIKSRLEATCPMTVSCADIIALATRDSVALGGGPKYSISTGRRDGLVSNPADVNLPGPSLTVQEALKFFTNKKFSLNDMVTLLGAHTVGNTHCSLFQDRLSRFDGSMDRNLFAKLSRTCAARGDPSVSLDQSTSFIVDNEFFKQTRLKKGILKIDQELASDRSTAGIVANFSVNPKAFEQAFANALIKLGNTEVVEGRLGEIRKNCRAFNPSQQKRQPLPPRKSFPPRKPKRPPPRNVSPRPTFSIPFLEP
ncbi:PREDICTED: peroxidase 44-like [Nicotiana attenuata]|uniref:Peroxidase n=1 Tax=Nicotiana attenuata TaxID=49451 RepID=A0A314LGT1_NICAT|nr:PREDICTED: peroxidase 44-like [Nicotiana attenuata]OIT39774.1 peroxidase 44 [Nicotiana attenuata]